jgi:hypothetical protein
MPTASARLTNDFNPAAYAVPAPFTYGNSARNSLWGLASSIGIRRFIRDSASPRINLEFRAEVFNIMNHANFDVPAANISVPAQVGRITNTTSVLRDIQFGRRLTF